MKPPHELWISIALAVVIAGIGTLIWSVLATYGQQFIEWIDR